MRDALVAAFRFVDRVHKDSPAIGNVKSWTAAEISAELDRIAVEHGVDSSKLKRKMQSKGVTLREFKAVMMR